MHQHQITVPYKSVCLQIEQSDKIFNRQVTLLVQIYCLLSEALFGKLVVIEASKHLAFPMLLGFDISSRNVLVASLSTTGIEGIEFFFTDFHFVRKLLASLDPHSHIGKFSHQAK